MASKAITGGGVQTSDNVLIKVYDPISNTISCSSNDVIAQQSLSSILTTSNAMNSTLSSIDTNVANIIGVTTGFALNSTLIDGTAKIKVLDGSGVPITSTNVLGKQALDVNLPVGGLSLVSTTAPSADASDLTLTGAGVGTTTTSAITPAVGCSYQVNISVTSITGTTPTLDIEVQESFDGTTWIPFYDFPRIIANGSYVSHLLPFTSSKLRYIVVIGGVSSSVSLTVNRLQSSLQSAIVSRQLIDRSIDLNTIGSITSSCVSGPISYVQSGIASSNVQMLVNIGNSSTTPVLQIQGSDDYGLSWYSIGGNVKTTPNSTVSQTINGIMATLYRAIVVGAGSGTTTGYVLLRCW